MGLQSTYFSQGTTLVADDQVPNRDLLDELLSAQEFKVNTVEDGAPALDTISKTPVDLPLLDVMMPHLSGLEVFRNGAAKFLSSSAGAGHEA